MDLVKIVNKGSKPLVLRHDVLGDVTIKPKKDRIVQGVYAFLYFGNPGAKNVGRDRMRDVEYTSARVQWGFYEGIMPEPAWEGTAIDPLSGNEIGPFKPAFECYDMEGERVYMVLDDPDGSLAAERGATPTDAQSDRIEQGAVESRIAALEAQIERLTNALTVQNAMGGGPVVAASSSPAEDDSGADPVDPDESGEGDSGTGDGDPGDGSLDVPDAPDDAPAVVKDTPRSTRVGSRGKTSAPKG